jgi:hypothetical protein
MLRNRISASRTIQVLGREVPGMTLSHARAPCKKS